MLYSIVAISVGASLGAISRWLLGMSLNALFPALPPGTLAANLLGSYLIGVAVAAFADLPAVAPEWRLFVITGFLGSLTTFSTFSAEVTTLIREGRLLLTAASVSLHAAGSLIVTFLGLATFALLKRV